VRVSDPTPLAAPHALAALWQAWGDPAAVTAAVRQVPTWGHLVAMAPGDLAALVGRFAAVPLPPMCPPLPALPAPARVLTATDPAWPTRLDPDHWPVLYTAGTLPAGPALLVAGGTDPSPSGVEAARTAALTATGDHIAVVATPTPGVGLVALRTAVAAGGTAVAVLPHAIDRPTIHQGLLDAVVRGGGAVVTAARPGAGPGPAAATQAARLMAALVCGCVVAEVGVPPAQGTCDVAAAVAAALPLVVPPPPQPWAPAGAAGLGVLTHPDRFSPTWFGTNARIDARLAAGLPAADHVPGDVAALAAAVRQVCGR
jgi:hypothetical protein